MKKEQKEKKEKKKRNLFKDIFLRRNSDYPIWMNFVLVTVSYILVFQDKTIVQH